MARTLLELIQQATNEIGILQPSQLVGQVDDQSRQLLALANREGKDFAMLANSRGGWQNLHKEYTFTTVSGTPDYALPSDFEYFVQSTFWDGSMRWELIGPITAQEKQILRYGSVTSGPRRKFYIRENRMYIEPEPTTTGETIAFDYYSNAWCQSSGGTAQQRWSADLDTYKLDEDCFVQGIKWRFLRAKGLDYSEEKKAYDEDCMRVLARDGGARDLSLVRNEGVPFISMCNVPDSGFGV